MSATMTTGVFATLNGSTTHFRRADADFPESSIVGDMTIQAWVKIATVSLPDKNDVVRKLSNAGQYAYLFRVDAGKLILTMSGDGTALLARKTSAAVVLANTWAHIAVTYDASGGSAIFYVDGEVKADNGAALPSSINNGSDPFIIGSPVQAQNLDGGVFNVALFDDIRTPSEIAISAANYDQVLSGAPNIIGQWRLNDAPGVTRVDNAQSDAGRDLDLVGGDTTNYETHSRTVGAVPTQEYGVTAILTGNIQRYIGTAADKAALVTTAVKAGSIFYETDTSTEYIWNGTSWNAL